MIRFAILIPIHNRLPVTRQGLKALSEALEAYKTGGKGACNFEIVIIDDGSTDGSSAWIAENYPDVHLLKGDGNLWWSGAINKGADHAIQQLGSDFVLLWNDDIAPTTGYFIETERVFADPTLRDAVVGSKIVKKEKPDAVWSVGGFFNRVWGNYGLYTDPGAAANGFFDCDWQPGMGTFVPCRLLQSHGLRWDDQVFPQYHGDSDFTLRCKEKGIPIKTSLDLVIYNSSETSGMGRITNFRKLWLSLFSLRSNYNLRKRFFFYRRHGVILLSYLGIGRTYYGYFGSFFKRTYFKNGSVLRHRTTLRT
jgi:GT2 family glycosyltransferase